MLLRLCLFTQHSTYQTLTSTAHQVLEVDKTEVLGEIAYAVEGMNKVSNESQSFSINVGWRMEVA